MLEARIRPSRSPRTIRHARAADRPDHPGRERQAWRAGGRRRRLIDLISSENDELKGIYTSGFAWIDGAIKKRGAADFVSATPAQQTELLDLIAYRRNQTDPELAPGIEFFTWVRRMTVDAFYTSEIGIKDIDYRGNAPMASYPSPTESIAYALKRSGLGSL